MTRLTEQQKELLFDYCLELTSPEETAQAQQLVFSDDQAAKLVASLKAGLSPLDSITPEPCPDELAEGTIWRARQAVRTGRLQLTELIAAEQKRKTGTQGFWRDVFGRLATAALFIIVGSIVIAGGTTGLNYARQKSWQNQCGSQLAGMFQSLSNYQADNQGQMPTLAASPNSPWWRVGDQRPENMSNTRRMWILVKYKYADQNDFMCPGQKPACITACNPQNYNDFPDRKLVTYSFRIGCPKPDAQTRRIIIVSDMNPVFENLPALSEPALNVNLIDKLMNQNSANHGGKGQNVLFCDGSVQFVKSRLVGPSNDDIFTIQDVRTYHGTEMPTSDSDAFLAP